MQANKLSPKKFLAPVGQLGRALGRHFPRTHLIAAGVAALALVGIGAMSGEKSEPRRHALPIKLAQAPAVAGDEITNAVEAEATPIDILPATELRSVEQTVRSGDTLSTLFDRAGQPIETMYQVLGSSKEAKKLARLNIGETLVFHVDQEDRLQKLVRQHNRLESTAFNRKGDDTFEMSKHQLDPDTQLAYREAVIENSLFVSGIEAGLTNGMLMEIADIFGSDIDFALDIRKGDRFTVLFEEKFLDGEKIGNGPIMAVSFTNRGETFEAVRYTDTAGDSNYYTPEGKSMRKAFIRTPLDIGRISSHFNPRRLHPVFKTVRPHRGTDYAAPRGTPIYATGDGRVLKAGYSKANGNYVFLQHGERYVTRYLHLTKRKVKTGQRVKQRQVIGTVGSTGYATGPHLHYEFLVDGVHRNPATIVRKLPKAKSISSKEMDRFKAHVAPALAQLARYNGETLLAQNEPAE